MIYDFSNIYNKNSFVYNCFVQLKEKIKNLPKEAGVYMMKNSAGEIIYIGKAKNLKNRVSSYFKGAHDGKVTAMVSHILDFEYFVVANENDALFLEASLINKHKPHYNILLKDDKHFPYIKIIQSAAKTKDRIAIARKKQNDGAEYFGPYFNGIKAGVLLDIIRTVYGNDPVCAKSFLRGECNYEVNEILSNRMQKAAGMRQFELAIAYRNGLRMIDRLNRKITNTAEDADAFTLGACRELGEILGLPRIPRRIECYDISHTAGENVVGSLTVFIDGVAEKSQYRKFKIRHGMGNNDFLSLNEVLMRRLKHTEWAFPDIMVIDGGKGQLSAVKSAVEDSLGGGAAGHYPQFAVISLAKQFELIYTTDSDAPIALSKHSYALRLLQRIRDEAHRFAITFHRKLRSKNILYNK
jgi:excinuclease ABC subunit C